MEGTGSAVSWLRGKDEVKGRNAFGERERLEKGGAEQLCAALT